MPDEKPKIIINTADLPYYSLPTVYIDGEEEEKPDPDKVMHGGNGPAG